MCLFRHLRHVVGSDSTIEGYWKHGHFVGHILMAIPPMAGSVLPVTNSHPRLAADSLRENAPKCLKTPPGATRLCSEKTARPALVLGEFMTVEIEARRNCGVRASDDWFTGFKPHGRMQSLLIPRKFACAAFEQAR